MRPINDHTTRRRAAVLAVAAGIALLAAACGSSSSGSAGSGSTTGRSTAYQEAVAYSQCMRAHGVPNFPDPNSKGQFILSNTSPGPSGGSRPSQAQLQALNTCRHLLPNGGQISQQQRQQTSAQLLKFAKCVRSHGIPNFPDPLSDGELTLKGTGLNPQSPQFQSAQRACQSLMPAAPGGGP
jgi:hypothetical protein